MKKSGADPKVKKTLVRNCERRVESTARKQVMRAVESSPMVTRASAKDTVLSEPSICSSALLTNYLSEVKQSARPPLTAEDLNVDRGELSKEVTKKLNFHFNDRIYRNLVELNASIEDLKTRKEKRPTACSFSKKDLEPSIEDFYEDEKESDCSPNIPVIKTIFKPIKVVENGNLHKLIASFEVL